MIFKKVDSKESKLGRRSKVKGASFERTIAKKFTESLGHEFIRVPASGGFVTRGIKNNTKLRGDIVVADSSFDCVFHIECKNQKTWKLQEWFKQAKIDCVGGKIPIVVFHRHNTGDNFVALSLEDFLSLVKDIKFRLWPVKGNQIE